MIPIVLALMTFGIAVSFFAHRSVAATEQTIRAAIDKGVITEPPQIAALREPVGLTWIERLHLCGLLMIILAIGIVAVSIVLIILVHGNPAPLFALAAFLAVVGFGLRWCGNWLRRQRAQA